jgi:hypothetical protein
MPATGSRDVFPPVAAARVSRNLAESLRVGALYPNARSVSSGNPVVSQCGHRRKPSPPGARQRGKATATGGGLAIGQALGTGPAGRPG